MAKECSICGDTQCLNLVDNPIKKENNICDICNQFSYNRSCNMCQLRFQDYKTHSLWMYVFIFLILVGIGIFIASLFYSGPKLRL